VQAKAEPRQLKVGGITPFTATDYPGRLSAVVFVQGCPWRCGYCHNPHLQARPSESPLQWPRVLEWLKKRVGLVDAVVFSGGEATMDPLLGEAMEEVRALGFAIGLHTACIYPARLMEVLPLADWVGFDVKAPFAQYEKVTGVVGSGAHVQACAELILASGIDYECRTTIHPSMLDERELLELAVTLAGLGVKNYAWQQFRPQGCLNATLMAAPGYPSPSILAQVEALFPRFTLRHD
jgi:pyruvate formate lyase activating enzyme